MKIPASRFSRGDQGIPGVLVPHPLQDLPQRCLGIEHHRWVHTQRDDFDDLDALFDLHGCRPPFASWPRS